MIRTGAFLRAYRALPHFAVNGVAGALARQRRPAWLVDAAVRSWVRRDRIDLSDFEPGPFSSVEHFFLRRLRPGARPLGDGFVSPVDGCLVSSGMIERGTIVQVKGQPLSLDRLVNGRIHQLPLGGYEGGRFLTLFLRPRGYHRVHAPCDVALLDVRWISGRFFPQNEDALRHIERIYERNERAVLRLSLRGDGREVLLVMVGASVVGSMHVEGATGLLRSASRAPVRIDRDAKKGDELGHFTFGSTVVLLMPRDLVGEPLVTPRQEVPMGTPLFVERAC